MSLRMPPAAWRSAMTLIELLVVIVILLLMLVTVVPILTPSADQKGREAAATVLSMINRAKLRAEANGDTGAGIWLEPLLTSGSLAGPLNGAVWWQLDGAVLPMATLDMFACEPQNPYNGDSPDSARVLIYPINETPPGRQFVANVPTTDYLALFELRDCSFIRELCGSSSRITTDGKSYYFRLLTDGEQQVLESNTKYFPRPYRECNDPGLNTTPLVPGDPYYVEDTSSNFYRGAGQNISPPPPPSIGGVPPLVVAWVRTLSTADAMDTAKKQNILRQTYSTIAPSFPVSSGVPFAIHRPSVRSPTPPLSVPEGYAVDVSWSSHGTQLFHNAVHVRAGQGGMTLLPNFLANQPVQFLFDSGGGLNKVLYKAYFWGFGGGQGAVVEQTLNVPADVFLLVGRADRVGRPYVANPTDQNPGANWQYPDSRWVKISHQTGKTLIADPVPGVTNVYDSQRYAREDLAAVRN